VLQDDGIHPDEGAIFDVTALQYRAVTYRDILTDRRTMVEGDVNDTVVLHAAASADDDAVFAVIGTKNGAIPDACVVSNHDVADQYGSRGDKRARRHFRPVTVELDERTLPPTAYADNVALEI
jgi:hypothetical protein